MKNLKSSFVMNGDKPLIKIEKNQLIACGTPWAGDERLNKNVMMPLRSMVFMEQSDKNQLHEISFYQAYPRLIQQTYIPRDSIKAKKALTLISQMYEKTKFWSFHCNNFADDCFEKSYTALVGMP